MIKHAEWLHSLKRESLLNRIAELEAALGDAAIIIGDLEEDGDDEREKFFRSIAFYTPNK